MTKEKENSFLLLYGSQTGQAKAIAEEVAEKATAHGLHANLHCISTTEKKFWLERETCLVLITSTTGEGEPPDTVSKFWRRIKKKTLPSDHLKHLHYALLGLGDSNYTNFCNCAKSLDRRFLELGASQMLPSAFADDAVGLDVVAEPWIDDLIFPAVRAHLGLSAQYTVNSEPTQSASLLNSLDEATCNKGNSEPSVIDQAETIVNGLSEPTSRLDNLGTCTVNDIDVPSVLVSSTDVSEMNRDSVMQIDSNSVKVNGQRNPENITQEERTNFIENEKLVSTNTTLTNSPTLQESVMEKLDESHSVVAMATEESVAHSLPPLSECSLNLPVCPPRFIHLEYNADENLDLSTLPVHNEYPFPSAHTEIQYVPIIAACVLTKPDAPKTALKLSLDISNTSWTYQPGDAFSIVCHNTQYEVQQLLDRLEVFDDADRPCTLSIILDSKKRNAAVPAYISPHATLRHWLSTALDIRSPPKKAFLRALVEFTSNSTEKRRLQELCSKQGATHYTKYIREAGLSIVDILTIFSSCMPPAVLLIEHLPRLQPRPYSAASCIEALPGQIDFVFNVIEIPAGSGRSQTKQGICTGWLADLTKTLLERPTNSINNLTLDLERLHLDAEVKIPMFLRSHQHFHPQSDLSVPVIMIGPGTGVAPFIGFLQHREESLKSTSDSNIIGESWLFFGCRHKEKDYIFRRELEYFVDKNVLSHLKVSFSRDSPDGTSPHYVQDNMHLHGNDLVTLMTDQGAEVYVCGDAKNMSKGVRQAFIEMLEKHKGLSRKEAEAVIIDMVINKRYHEDVWS